MAKFFKHLGVVGLRKSSAEEQLFPVPAGATDFIAFDEETNVGVMSAFDADCNSHSLSGGQLMKNGVAVSFAADGQNKSTRDAIRTQAAQAIGDNNTYLALASPSNAQVAAQVKSLTQQNSRIIKRLVLLISELGKE